MANTKFNFSPQLNCQHNPKENTHQSEVLRNRGKQVKILTNPFFRYNYFIACYNTNYNMINSTKLAFIKPNRFYYKLYPILDLQNLVFTILCLFIPYFNLLLLSILITLYVIYEIGNRTYKANLQLIKDPFARMIYHPELCEHFNCMNKFLDLPKDIIKHPEAKIRENADGRVPFMIYNQNFKKMFNDFSKHRKIHLSNLLTGMLVTCFSYYYLYERLGILDHQLILGMLE